MVDVTFFLGLGAGLMVFFLLGLAVGVSMRGPPCTFDDLMDNATWTHLKRGTRYRVLTLDAHLNISPVGKVLNDRDRVAIYRDVDTGAWAVRSTPEFLDGRFVEVRPGARG